MVVGTLAFRVNIVPDDCYCGIIWSMFRYPYLINVFAFDLRIKLGSGLIVSKIRSREEKNYIDLEILGIYRDVAAFGLFAILLV